MVLLPLFPVSVVPELQGFTEYGHHVWIIDVYSSNSSWSSPVRLENPMNWVKEGSWSADEIWDWTWKLACHRHSMNIPRIELLLVTDWGLESCSPDFSSKVFSLWMYASLCVCVCVCVCVCRQRIGGRERETEREIVQNVSIRQFGILCFMCRRSQANQNDFIWKTGGSFIWHSNRICFMDK